MMLQKDEKEFYGLTITTTPVTVSTAWEASFDGGTTWIASTTVDGHSAWLVAGPLADPTGAVAVIDKSLSPRIRLIEAPEVLVEYAPRIYLQ